MRAEEDVKEVKQNFYRVMHCAFAKYEQGFKRKNEYLERRRVKRREEIEKGVREEMRKRGLGASAGGGGAGLEEVDELLGVQGRGLREGAGDVGAATRAVDNPGKRVHFDNGGVGNVEDESIM